MDASCFRFQKRCVGAERPGIARDAVAGQQRVVRCQLPLQNGGGLAERENARVQIDFIKGERRLEEDARIAPGGCVRAAFAHQQRHVHAPRSGEPSLEVLPGAAAPAVEADGAREAHRLGVCKQRIDEFDRIGVGGVARQHPGGKPVPGEVRAERAHQQRVFARRLAHVDAQVGFIEGKKGRFDAIFLFHEEQISRN